LPVIPSRSNATKKTYCPKRFYRQRHKIENFFCRVKDRRRVATRYDKLARNFLAATLMVGTLYWIKLRVQTLPRGHVESRRFVSAVSRKPPRRIEPAAPALRRAWHGVPRIIAVSDNCVSELAIVGEQ
jgi:hypothetical protein